MLLDELITVIETLKQRITDHGAILQDNETRTRMALIDPLLHVLGWDATDPFLVIPEFDAGGGQVDYALLGKKGGPTAVIEAKRLGEPLQKYRHKMIRYAKDAGINCAGITDGDQWELYDTSPPRRLTRRTNTGPADLGLSFPSDRPKSSAPLAAQSLFSTTCTGEKNNSRRPSRRQSRPARSRSEIMGVAGKIRLS